MPVDQGPHERASAALRRGDIDTAIKELDQAQLVPISEMPDEHLPRKRMTEGEIAGIARMLGITELDLRTMNEEAYQEAQRRGLVEELEVRGCFRTQGPSKVRHGAHDWVASRPGGPRYRCEGSPG